MDVDHVFVMFCSEGGGPFLPVARENIPDWLRDDDVIQKMLEGNVAKRADENKTYRAIEIDRPRPVGQREKMFNIDRLGNKSPGGILLTN